MYCFCGNVPLLALLQDAKTDASAGTVPALEKIVPAIRRRFGRKVQIVLRADSGFARDTIMDWCERNEVFYCLGLARNQRLQAELAPSFEALQSDLEAGLLKLPVRRFVEFEYRTLSSWTRRRRVVGKAEVLAKGQNPRFVVTNFDVEHFDARALYEDFYCARGDMENRNASLSLHSCNDPQKERAARSNRRYVTEPVLKMSRRRNMFTKTTKNYSLRSSW